VLLNAARGWEMAFMKIFCFLLMMISFLFGGKIKKPFSTVLLTSLVEMLKHAEENHGAHCCGAYFVGRCRPKPKKGNKPEGE
jgi:hypothetical protein